MAQTIHATFDGHVLRPEKSVGLETNKRYLLTVEEEAGQAPPGPKQRAYPLSELLGLAADAGVTDLAERHDDYARRR